MIGQNDVQAEQFTLDDAAGRQRVRPRRTAWARCRCGRSTATPRAHRRCRPCSPWSRPRAAGSTRAASASPTCWPPTSAPRRVGRAVHGRVTRRAPPRRRPRRRPRRSTTPRTAPSRSGTRWAATPGGRRSSGTTRSTVARYWTTGVAPDMPVRHRRRTRRGPSWAPCSRATPRHRCRRCPPAPTPQWDADPGLHRGDARAGRTRPLRGQVVVAGARLRARSSPAGSPWLLVTPGS